MKNFLLLKATLLTEGIGCDSASLKAVGTQFKEQNHGLFGWDFEDHVGMTLPDDFLLPDGTVVQFRRNSRSPYHVTAEGSKLVLFKGEEELCEVRWIPRPAFYSKKTANGNGMVKVGQIGGEDCLFFSYQNYCSHFAKGEQCLFCNLVSTSKTYNSVLKKKATDDIGEVAKVAFAEGQVKHVLLTGGCFNHRKELETVKSILASIREQTGFDRVPGTVLPSPARNEEEIRMYYDTGINALGFSLEIWDSRLYAAICPGKSNTISHDEFLTSIKIAVKIFGAGNVYGVLVMGLEPKASFLEGVKVLANLGVNVVPFVWSPNPGSKLEGHRAPSPQWYFDVISEAAEVVYQSKVPAGTENHCYQCDGNSLLHDALRLKGVQ